MDWIDEVQNKINRKNQILFAKDSAFLADLIELIAQQNHRTLVLWAFEFADEATQQLLERHPSEKRFETVVMTAKDWAFAKVKMPVAKRAILDAHTAAKEMDSLEDIALGHAIGQACSVVHTEGHAIGFPIYDLTSLVRKYGIPACKEIVENRKQQYIERLHYWREHYDDYPLTWAEFMMRD